MSDTTVDLGVPALAEGGTAEIPPLEAPTLEPSEAPDPLPSPGEPAKRKRRRRTKAQMQADAAPAPAPSVEPSPDDIARLSIAFGAGFRVVGDVLATARGAHWRLDDAEVKALGDAWAPAMAPYMGGAGRYMPFVVAGLTTVGVFLPRVQQDAARVQDGPVPPQIPSTEVYTKPADDRVTSEAPGASATPATVAESAPPSDASVPIEPPPGRKRAKVTP